MVDKITLSEHFSYKEAVATSRVRHVELNALKGLEYLDNMKRVASSLLEPIRVHFNMPVVCSSWFRYPDLNKDLYGERTSEHLTASAADFRVKNVPMGEVFTWIYKVSDIVFGQLIHETRFTIKGNLRAEWLHISLPSEKHKRPEVWTGVIKDTENGVSKKYTKVV